MGLAFTSPAALIALAALALPIALHLWSRRTGRPLRVGSVAFFAAAPPPAARRPRLEDLWLLLLRCGIVALLAFALAGPVWRSGRLAGGGRVMALVTPAVAADSASRPLLDSLRQSGADIEVLPQGPIWSVLREADFEAPPGTRFVIVAPAEGASGNRPVLRSEASWIIPPLRMAERGTGGEAAVRRRGTRSVLIYSDASRRDDARYVAAALRAAAQATGAPATVSRRDVRSPAVEADWIVWLASRPLPPALLEYVRRGATLLTDAQDAEPLDRSATIRLAVDAGASPPLVRRRTQPAAGAAPVWTDDGGQALLTLRREGEGRVLHLHSRFHPDWGDLVLHPAFPLAMAELWARDRDRGNPGSARVATSQLLPARDTTAGHSAPAVPRDLYHVFWLAAVALFVVERVVAGRPRAVTGAA